MFYILCTSFKLCLKLFRIRNMFPNTFVPLLRYWIQPANSILVKIYFLHFLSITDWEFKSLRLSKLFQVLHLVWPSQQPSEITSSIEESRPRNFIALAKHDTVGQPWKLIWNPHLPTPSLVYLNLQVAHSWKSRFNSSEQPPNHFQLPNSIFFKEGTLQDKRKIDL